MTRLYADRVPDDDLARATVLAYHERSKHRLDRYATARDTLDWALQPHPFRRFIGSPRVLLARRFAREPVAFDRIYDGAGLPLQPLTLDVLADFLRHSLALSAWKQWRTSRWSLRVNPSSGNLHPTEATLVLPALPGLGEAGVFHYTADEHALQRRATVSEATWRAVLPGVEGGAFLVGLTSVVWREAWKYGERAFRYCQHDAGHALAALRFAANLQGWKLAVLPRWPDDSAAALLGVDRSADFVAEERDVPEMLLAVGPAARVDALAAAAAPDEAALARWRTAAWHGTAAPLSRDHHDWPVLGEIVAATDAPARAPGTPCNRSWPPLPARANLPDARRILLQRRSAVDFDGTTRIPRDALFAMLDRTLPRAFAPFDAWPWPAEVDLLLFVHRVDGLPPGAYVLARTADGAQRLRAGTRAEFAWSPVEGAPAHLPLFFLAGGDTRPVARLACCHQEIAADGCFALAMLARFAPALAERGASFYRALFQETGMIGQVLYLEAEVHGVRGTGIGCFFDDVVHEVLGRQGDGVQALYCFTVGGPVEDARLTTEPGYPEG